MTYCLSVVDVVAIHDQVCSTPGLRDLGSLQGTLARPMHTGFGEEVYPTVLQKAAALLHGLARTQPFMDGNKRTAWTACVTFLGNNGIEINATVTDDDVYEFVMGIAVGECDEVVDIALTLSDWTI